MNMERKTIYHGAVVDLGLETADLPNGHTMSLEVIRHRGGAAVVAIDEEERVCLLRQYRHAAGDWVWELPAGKCDGDEAALLTAQRELEEDAGLRAADWRPLGEILTTPGFCDEVIHLFLARQLRPVPARPETHEVFERHWIPLRKAQEWARNGTLRDAKTVIGLLRTALTPAPA